MTEGKLDSVIRRAYSLGLKDGYNAGWRNGVTFGKRRANGKTGFAKRAGRPRKGSLTNEEFLDLLAQARSAVAAE